MPTTLDELRALHGFGLTRVEEHGSWLLAEIQPFVDELRAAHDELQMPSAASLLAAKKAAASAKQEHDAARAAAMNKETHLSGREYLVFGSEALEATALQPILAPTPSAMQACCFLLEKYGRHNYAAVANSHMNRPPLLQAVEGPRRRVGVAQLPRSRPLRGAKLKELERWSEPYKRVGFENVVRAITAAHMVPAARLVRLADHMVLGALLRRSRPVAGLPHGLQHRVAGRQPPR